MDYSNSNGQQSSTEGENKSSVFGGMWDGIKNSFSGLKNKVTGMITSPSTEQTEQNPNPPTGGKGRKGGKVRKHKKSMKGGKSKKHMSSKSHKGKKRTAGRR
jgi:hypothetical protein